LTKVTHLLFLLSDRSAVTRGFFRPGQRGAQLRQALERNTADQSPRHARPIKFSDSTCSPVLQFEASALLRRHVS
jgi:hypothetical protein